MVYVYHSFLIHLSADGHLGYFHVLAIVNSAVMNICLLFFLCYLYFFFWHLENIKVEVDLEG